MADETSTSNGVFKLTKQRGLAGSSLHCKAPAEVADLQQKAPCHKRAVSPTVEWVGQKREVAWAFSHVPAYIKSTQKQQSIVKHDREDVGRTRGREMQSGLG